MFLYKYLTSYYNVHSNYCMNKPIKIIIMPSQDHLLIIILFVQIQSKISILLEHIVLLAQIIILFVQINTVSC